MKDKLFKDISAHRNRLINSGTQDLYIVKKYSISSLNLENFYFNTKNYRPIGKYSYFYKIRLPVSQDPRVRNYSSSFSLKNY